MGNSTQIQWSEAQKYIQMSRYSRWRDDLGRREFWSDAVERYLGFMKERFEDKVPKHIWKKAEAQMLNLGVLGSMRALWSAGPALAENNILAYNCCYLPFIDLKAVAELFYVLMCGTGVGFSVEEEYISKMPVVKPQTGNGRGTFVVPDSREGWADALTAGLEAWFAGEDIDFDYSLIRPKGARLMKMGGRASGPDPLKELLVFVRKTVIAAGGRKLTDLEWQDVGNMVGEVVVVGGIRRASEIAFSDRGSEAIRHAKVGWAGVHYPVYRKNSNNTATYFSKPTMVEFMEEWAALAKSGTGERGFYNVEAIKNLLPKRRKFVKGMRSNPCGEILLRPFEFCNLTEIVVRSEDEFDDLVQKAEVAVWLGAMQSCLTEFPYIREEFRKNCEEERLLGVSLTGQLDNVKLLSEDRLGDLKKYILKVAKRASEALDINLAAAITTGKPSGTVSQLAQCGSGAHPWHAEEYIRRYRNAATDPLYRMMKDQGVKWFPEVGEENKPEEKVTTWVCEFPVKAPKGALTREAFSAIDQLEWYLHMQENWCEHNQSITVYVKDEEWLKVGAWVYENWNRIVGISFLPYDGGTYKLAPYETITAEEYDKRVKEFPVIDYSKLSQYEKDDYTTGAKEAACVGGSCELNF